MPREPAGVKGWLNAVAKDFSVMIRVEAADTRGRCECVTCGAQHYWKSGLIHAGHFRAYRFPNSPVRFFETNVHCQCRSCNTTGLATFSHWGSSLRRESVAEAYFRFMLATYGHDVIDEIERIRNQESIKHTPETLRTMRAEYRHRAAVAIEAKGL